MTRYIRVRGIPQAQGSAKAFVRGGRAVIATGVGQGKPLGSWREAIATEARREFGDEPASRTGVRITIELAWPRPLAHFRGGKATNQLRADAPTFKTSAPDADKCARAVLDALSGIAYVDDSQVASLMVLKTYGDAPGAVIVISEMGVQP